MSDGPFGRRGETPPEGPTSAAGTSRRGPSRARRGRRRASPPTPPGSPAWPSLLVLIYVTVNTITHGLARARAASRTGQKIPPFAAPLALANAKCKGDEECDANVLIKARKGVPKACDVRGPDIVNSCELAETGPLVLAFLVAPSQKCIDQIDTLDGLQAALPGRPASRPWRSAATTRTSTPSSSATAGRSRSPTTTTARSPTRSRSRSARPSPSPARAARWRRPRSAPPPSARSSPTRSTPAHVRVTRAGRVPGGGRGRRRAARPAAVVARPRRPATAPTPDELRQRLARHVEPLPRRAGDRPALQADPARLPGLLPPHRPGPRRRPRPGRGGGRRAAQGRRLPLARRSSTTR